MRSAKIEHLFNKIMAKIKIEKKNSKPVAKLRVGDKVILVGEYWYGRGSSSNPYYESSYACEGRIDEFEEGENSAYVIWDNGRQNSYMTEDLKLVVAIDSPPTRTVVRINMPISVGGVEIVKRNSRMFVQGDYAHDENGLFFIKIDDRLLPKKLFNNK